VSNPGISAFQGYFTVRMSSGESNQTANTEIPATRNNMVQVTSRTSNSRQCWSLPVDATTECISPPMIEPEYAMMRLWKQTLRRNWYLSSCRQTFVENKQHIVTVYRHTSPIKFSNKNVTKKRGPHLLSSRNKVMQHALVLFRFFCHHPLQNANFRLINIIVGASLPKIRKAT